MNPPMARPAGAALKATLVGGISGSASFSAVAPAASTLRGPGPVKLAPIDVDATLLHDEAASAPALAVGGTSAGGRTTVLPRRRKTDDAAKLVAEQRPRFDRV